MKKTTTNETVLKNFKEGDINAFHQIYQQYCSELLLLAFHFLKNKEEAEETVQDIFLKIWEKRETINEKLAFQGFLFVVAKRTLLNKVKAKSKYKFTEVNDWSAITTSNMEDQLIGQELVQLSERAISQLPAKRKEIYLMSREQKLTYNEIAQKLGISRKTVENQIVLALKGIKEHLQSYSDYSFSLSLFLIFFS